MKKLLLLLVIVPMCAWGQVIITIAGNTPVGSGNGNSLGDIGAVIGGGNTNKVTADNWSGIFNGNLNLIESCYGVIAGGAYNCLSTASSCYGTMGGGKCNTISACYSSIISGYKNIISSPHSVVVGGDCNCITDITGHYSCYSFIGGGKCNFISRDSCYSFIGGGGGPIGGVAGPNCICVAAYSGIASGSGNCIAGTNTVSNCYANFSFIGGGQGNCLHRSCTSVITDGAINTMGNVPVVAGIGTTAGGGFCVLVSGNVTAGFSSVGNVSLYNIGNDCMTTVSLTNSTYAAGTTTIKLGSGVTNTCQYIVRNDTCFGADSGIRNKSSIGNGVGNKITGEYNTISNGYQNCISGIHSSILGGCKNISTGNCSVVLGGSGSCDNGHHYAGVFGCNVVAVIGCAYHANNFIAQNIPLMSAGAPTGLPSGAFYADDVTTFGVKCLLIV